MTTSIHKKLLEIQQSMPRIDKDSKNPHFKSNYASLSNILSIALPIINKCGLYHTNEQKFDQSAGWVLIVKLVDAENGESIQTALPLLNLADSQKMGGCITYSQRYGLLPMLGIAPEMDDDGNGISLIKSNEKSITDVEIEDKVSTNNKIMNLYNNYSAQLKVADKAKAEAIALGVASNHKDVNIVTMKNRLTWMQGVINYIQESK